MNVESATGGGAINSTHMVAFQEETEHTSLLYTHKTGKNEIQAFKNRKCKFWKTSNKY